MSAAEKNIMAEKTIMKDDVSLQNLSDNLRDSKEVPLEHTLNWPWYRKHWTLALLALHGATPGITSTILIPGVPELAQQFRVSETKAVYLISVPILFLGIAPILWAYASSRHGRKPILIASMSIACVTHLGGGFAHSFGTLMAARILHAVGISAGFVVPAAVIVDIFWQHERGCKTGIWAQMTTMGPAIGGIIAGPLIKNCGWRWGLWTTSILNAVQALLYLTTFTETMWRPIKTKIWTPLLFLQSPAVVLASIAYAVCFGITSVGVANIVPLAFGKFYGFGPLGDGLTFISILVGVTIGEQFAGRISDRMMRKHSQVPGWKLEYRLRTLLPAFVLVPGALTMFGTSLGRTHWIVPCIGMGIANGGLQIVTTAVVTYCIDIHSGHAMFVLQLVNVIRQCIAFSVPFWSPVLCQKVGYGLGFGIEAIIVFVFLTFYIVIYLKGPRMREVFSVRGL